MSDTAVRTAYVEAPVFFEASGTSLFGLVTLPREGTARTGLIIMPGGGTPLTVNRNRVSVRLCRELAALGYAGMRFDYHGVGDSAGSIDQFRLDRPFVDDVAGAVACLQGMGVERVILAGSCFGGRTALSAAAELDDVAGVILIAVALRDSAMGEHKSLSYARRSGFGRYLRVGLRPSTLRGLIHGRTRRTYAKYARTKFRMTAAKLPGIRRWVAEKPVATDDVSPVFEGPLRTLARRGVPVRFLYGEDDAFFKDEYRSAADGPLADLLPEDASGPISLTVLPGRLHGFTTIATQDAVIQDIVGWAASRRSGDDDRVEAP